MSVEQPDPVLTNALIILVKKRERSELVNAINIGLKSTDSNVRANAAVVLAAAGVDSEPTAKALMEALDISESDTAEIQYAIFGMGTPVVDLLFTTVPVHQWVRHESLFACSASMSRL